MGHAHKVYKTLVARLTPKMVRLPTSKTWVLRNSSLRNRMKSNTRSSRSTIKDARTFAELRRSGGQRSDPTATCPSHSTPWGQWSIARLSRERKSPGRTFVRGEALRLRLGWKLKVIRDQTNKSMRYLFLWTISNVFFLVCLSHFWRGRYLFFRDQ
jgi:hypothetical protein